MTTAQKIIDYKKVNPNASAKEIAKKFKTKVQYVYTTIYMDRKRQSNKQTKAQKASAKARPTAPVVEQAQSNLAGYLHKMNDALKREAASLRKEIDELTVIIAYLEHRCARAEAKHGSTV